MDNVNEPSLPPAEPNLIESRKAENHAADERANEALGKAPAVTEPWDISEEEYFYYDI